VGRKENPNGSFINSTFYPSFNNLNTFNPPFRKRFTHPHFNSKDCEA
jgi:hypothetical protein